MTRARIPKFNTHPDFIGTEAFIHQINVIWEILCKALGNNDYDTARNPKFVHFCFPSSEPGEYGYKYVVYDERERIESQCKDQLADARKLFMAAYGFNIDTGRFYQSVPPVSIRALDIEFMQHISTPSLRLPSFRYENFIAGFIDCGLSMGKYNSYWLEQRNNQDASRILDVSFRNNLISYYVANGDRIAYKGDIYDTDTLNRQTKWVKTLEKVNEYNYSELVNDSFGRLWLHKYSENDHIFHIEHSYSLVQDREHPDRDKPSFQIIIGSGIETFTLYVQSKQQVTEEFVQNEIIKLKRLNGWIPDVV